METAQAGDDANPVVVRAWQLHRYDAIGPCSGTNGDFASLLKIASNCLAAGLSTQEACEQLIEEINYDP